VRRARAAAVLAAVALAAAAAPAPASAHGISGRADLPIPPWLFAWAAAGVLVVSFLALATLWRSPRLERPRERVLGRVPAWLEAGAGALGVAAFALVVYSGLAGTREAAENLAPTAIYVLFWVGLAVASALVGDVFRALNPWRAIARAVAWVAGRAVGDALPAPLPYPARLGRWPAAAVLFAFAWLELVAADRDDPSLLAVLALLYAMVQLVGMSLFGIETWTDRADGFSVYFGLFARLSPLAVREGRLVLRRALSGATTLAAVPGTLAVLCVMLGTTTFDGFSNSTVWNDFVPSAQRALVDAGFGLGRALDVIGTLGMLASVAAVSAVYGLGVRGMRSVEGAPAAALPARFAHTLVPIALAYVVAHYFSLLLFQGQALGYLASDPLGNGANLLGTAAWAIDYTLVSGTGIWYVQVGALVLGHVAGLVLAHDRALVTWRSPVAATRSQYWMLVTMVAYTSLGLWLLSAVNA
jgi:hypothetical protein